jgi:hypothetical protein
MIYFLGIIGPIKILTFGIIFLIQFIFAVFLIGKYEKGWNYFAWLLVIFFLPIIGSLAYFMKSLNKVKIIK